MRSRNVLLGVCLYASALLLGAGTAVAWEAPAQPIGVAQVAPAGFPRTHPLHRVGPVRGLVHGSVSTSSNWSGYDVTAGTYTSVVASCTLPAVAATAAESDASFWVGLDGDGSPSVEQIGVDASGSGNVASYYAWYELYPAPTVLVPLPVKPGDRLTCTVMAGVAGSFRLEIVDATTSRTYSTLQSVPGAPVSSAEVIAEAPTDSSSGAILPLADFGTVTFSGCQVDSQPIGSYSWNRIDMVSKGGVKLAGTSALSADGAGFSVSTLRHSPSVTLKTSRSSLKAGSSVTLSGKVQHPAAGVASVRLERAAGGKLVLVRRLPLSGSGGFTWKMKLTRAGPWLFEAVYGTGAGRVMSAPVPVTVHR